MNTKLIIGTIITLLFIGAANQAKAWPGVNGYTGCIANRGNGAPGFYGPPRVYGGGCGYGYGGGYGGYYGGGYGGGWNSYGVAQTATTLGGIAAIASVIAPVLAQPSVQYVQPQQPVVYIINPK